VTSLNRYADSGYYIVRIVVGLMFACHGGQKILGFPLSARGLASPTALADGWIELVASFLIALGLLTGLASFIASGEIPMLFCLYFSS
jgi:putative oxidoreductase